MSRKVQQVFLVAFFLMFSSPLSLLRIVRAGSRNQCFPAAAAMQFSTSTYNSVLDQSKVLPRFDKFKVDDVIPAIEGSLSSFKQDFEKLEKKFDSESSPTYATLFDELERIQNPLSHAWGMVSHLTSVKTTDELRAAHEEMQPKVVETMQRVSQSKPLYDALLRLDKSKLDPVQQRIVDKSIRAMKKSGIGLPDQQREKFNKLKLRQAELSTQFSNNVLDSTKAFKLRLTEKAEIEGLTVTGLGMLTQNAIKEGEENATVEGGPWIVTLDVPTFVQFMKHSKRKDLRKTVHRAYISRASSGDYDNQPIISEILHIRRQICEILGYESYAALSLDSKMASSVDEILSLTEFLKDKALPFAHKELAELEKFANAKIDHEDMMFWSERQKEAKFEFSEEELREYFPLEQVLDGLFGLIRRLFGVSIEPSAPGDIGVWHPDVRYFHVKDAQTGNVMGGFFVDPYARPQEKRGGAWMNDCTGKSKVLGTIPVAYLICNGSPVQDEKPSLMTLSDVETLFHEMGHSLQHMLTKVEYSDAAGINGIEWDAVELPSQFLEEFFYDRTTLFAFAKHYKTGETLPEELYKKICAARHYNAGMAMIRQLGFGALDLALHGNKHMDVEPMQLQRQILSEFSVLPSLKEDRFLCSFQHIFAGGYAAGYYSYIWAKVMSADAFAAFEEVGLSNDDEIQKLGLRFRNTVLALGGGTHPTQVFKEFRGREPHPQALLRHSLGLEVSKL